MLVAKYGYRSLHSALIEVLKNLKIDGISVNFEGLLHYFNGTLSMVVAGNLAAHALGGFFHSTNFCVVFVILPKLSRMKKSLYLILLCEQKMLKITTSLPGADLEG